MTCRNFSPVQGEGEIKETDESQVSLVTSKVQPPVFLEFWRFKGIIYVPFGQSLVEKWPLGRSMVSVEETMLP